MVALDALFSTCPLCVTEIALLRLSVAVNQSFYSFPYCKISHSKSFDLQLQPANPYYPYDRPPSNQWEREVDANNFPLLFH